MDKLVLVFVILISFSFAVNANELVITTAPEKAEIKISMLKGGEAVKVGESPFKMSLKEISSSYANNSDMFVVEVVKEGHETYRIVVPAFFKSAMTLDIVLQPRADWDEYKKIDKLVNELFEVQRMLRGKNYSSASSKIDELEKKFPKLSITKELKASGHYLQNEYKQALDLYKQAYFANTENIDAYKMMVYLEKSLGVKKPNGDKDE